MTSGRWTPAGVRDEMRTEIGALGHELVVHDQWEMATYETVDAALRQVRVGLMAGQVGVALADINGCLRIIAELRRRDLEENRRHREIVVAAREGRVAG